MKQIDIEWDVFSGSEDPAEFNCEVQVYLDGDLIMKLDASYEPSDVYKRILQYLGYEVTDC